MCYGVNVLNCYENLERDSFVILFPKIAIEKIYSVHEMNLNEDIISIPKKFLSYSNHTFLTLAREKNSFNFLCTNSYSDIVTHNPCRG